MSAGLHMNYAQERIYFGKPHWQALQEELNRVRAGRVFIVTTRSLTKPGGLVETLSKQLGPAFVGQYSDMVAHSPRECVISAANCIRETGADAIVAIGGGSVIDTSKVAQLCLWRDINTVEGLDELRLAPGFDPSLHDRSDHARPRVIAIPTTLSAAEFTYFAGVRNSSLQMKEAFAHSKMVPQAILLDPEVLRCTPPGLIFSTGIKAVEHAVEAFLSVMAHPVSDALTLQGIRLLVGGLRRLHAEPGDLQALHMCQLGMWSAMAGASSYGVGGISHTIGAVLGGFANVPHGATACLSLPAVLRWSRTLTEPRQQEICACLGTPGQSLDAVLTELIALLGLPQRMSDVGVREQQYAEIVEKIMLNQPPFQHHLPRPASRDDVLHILELAG